MRVLGLVPVVGVLLHSLSYWPSLATISNIRARCKRFLDKTRQQPPAREHGRLGRRSGLLSPRKVALTWPHNEEKKERRRTKVSQMPAQLLGNPDIVQTQPCPDRRRKSEFHDEPPTFMSLHRITLHVQERHDGCKEEEERMRRYQYALSCGGCAAAAASGR